jgi:replication factor C subunit 1
MLTGNGVPYPRFPEWFAKNSLQRRNERLLREVRGAMAKQISGDNERVLNDYVPAVYKLIMEPIKTEGKMGVEKSIEVMKTYHINPDTFKEHLVQLQFGTFSYEQEFKAIP